MRKITVTITEQPNDFWLASVDDNTNSAHISGSPIDALEGLAKCMRLRIETQQLQEEYQDRRESLRYIWGHNKQLNALDKEYKNKFEQIKRKFGNCGTVVTWNPHLKDALIDEMIDEEQRQFDEGTY